MTAEPPLCRLVCTIYGHRLVFCKVKSPLRAKSRSIRCVWQVCVMNARLDDVYCTMNSGMGTCYGQRFIVLFIIIPDNDNKPRKCVNATFVLFSHVSIFHFSNTKKTHGICNMQHILLLRQFLNVVQNQPTQLFTKSHTTIFKLREQKVRIYNFLLQFYVEKLVHVLCCPFVQNSIDGAR